MAIFLGVPNFRIFTVRKEQSGLNTLVCEDDPPPPPRL